MTSQLLPRIYFRMQRLQLRLVSDALAISNGIWLGVLSRSALGVIDDMYYVGSVAELERRVDYRADAYNKQGLWLWERQAIERYFSRKGRLAVLGAGGGREVLALKRLGFEVDGWECQEEFVNAANRILTANGLEATVSRVPRDTCPPGDPSYSGIVMGWGLYTGIPGSQRRIALLRAVRERLGQGSPVLLSFFSRDSAELIRFHLTATIANILRPLARRERVEVGDYLTPNYGHFFTESEVRSELESAGFTLAMYSTNNRMRPYAHAVAIAYPPPSAQEATDHAS
jgi:hypothetical protein